MRRVFFPVLLLAIPTLCLATSIACERWISWPRVKEKIRREFPEVEQVDAHELASQLAASDSREPVLLDVRQPREYAVSHLPGAVRLDPDLTDSKAILAALPAGTGRETPLVLYCSVGYRSSRMAERLTALGFTRVANLEGSIFEWANKGLPLVRDGERVEEVHPYDASWGRLLEPRYRARLEEREHSNRRKVGR